MERLARVIARLDATLDWPLLGQLYCSEGGEDFFCEEQRDALVESGMEFAQELGARLGAADSGGSSLYVGAAVFELLPALFESIVLERQVTLLNLDQTETSELNRGLARVAEETGVVLPRVEICSLARLSASEFDHLWMTSVLTDPDAFPALHDLSYERGGTELGTNRGDLQADCTAATQLIREALNRVTPAFWLTTTDEELTLFESECEARSLSIDVPESGRLSGIVGDPVRHCFVEPLAPSE